VDTKTIRKLNKKTFEKNSHLVLLKNMQWENPFELAKFTEENFVDLNKSEK